MRRHRVCLVVDGEWRRVDGGVYALRIGKYEVVAALQVGIQLSSGSIHIYRPLLVCRKSTKRDGSGEEGQWYSVG